LQRGVTFEQVIEIIANGQILLDFKHPKIERYPNQRIMVISIKNYPYCIPYIMNDKENIKSLQSSAKEFIKQNNVSIMMKILTLQIFLLEIMKVL
jgi:ubiquinone/menaquinone biosynthesis C-methylase UbiE